MLRILPWRFLVKHAARRYGVLDPITFLARMRRFAQPSEVAEPIELLRAGIVFHARGLVNVKVIQFNLDWIWPHWVERQFNPSDSSFIPRAFSFSHVNLTHRNWTAVGLPESAAYPIIDPRGLLTPLHDGWSLDFWVISESGKRLLPSKLADADVKQRLLLEPAPAVETLCEKDNLRLELATRMEPDGVVRTDVRAMADEDGWLVIALRPYNPEGVQFIHDIALEEAGCGWRVNEETAVDFGERPDSVRMTNYEEGDVSLDLPGARAPTRNVASVCDRRTSADPAPARAVTRVRCEVGMATAVALFRLTNGQPRTVRAGVPTSAAGKLPDGGATWESAVAGTAAMRIPDGKMQFLYDAAVRTLILLSADELVPGPYTYRRFWFRDACLMLHPLLVLGLADRAERIIGGFPARQTLAGYFLSQEGEWDSNGQVLWIAARYAEMTGRPLDGAVDRALQKGARWLGRKRTGADAAGGTAGLLPAGFSAEHLGPNDFYYWDDWWAVAGLRRMAAHWREAGDEDMAAEADALAGAFSDSIERSIAAIPETRSRGGIPAAPERRMDSGAVGSMVADYPLQLFPPGEARMMGTLEYLMEHSFHRGGFFQQMIHSGINAYLTLDLAQTLLRAGDPGYAALIRAVADLASPTGQWPEAIHPNTLGGCMGDGQHGWAAGEWIMMMRNCFVREEPDEDLLIIGSGIFPEWLESGGELFYGPTLTKWGAVGVSVKNGEVTVQAEWRAGAPRIRIAIPGRKLIDDAAAGMFYHLES